jgi:sporulation protein YlmC with PRC-barrel domain
LLDQGQEATMIQRIAPYLFLLLLAPAWAQEKPKDAAAGATVDKATWYDMRTSELIGKEVYGRDGKSLGEVEDVIIDVRRGAVQHVILSFGGVADLGDKLYIFPANAFKRHETHERLVLEVAREQLRQSRGFDKSNWPFQPPLRRASELRGANVKDAQGKAAGEIEDLELNLGTGRIERVWLAQDGRKGAEPKKSLPLSAFTIPAERGGEVTLKR